MEKINIINIEEIMQEIREEIKKNGYTNDMLSFNDITIDETDLKMNKFDKVIFNEELYAMNTSWNIQAYRPLVCTGTIKSKMAVFIKKVIRKCIKFYVEPITDEQAAFNANIVRTFNLLDCYISENKSSGELQEKIKELLIEQDKLKQEIAELKRCLDAGKEV